MKTVEIDDKVYELFLTVQEHNKDIMVLKPSEVMMLGILTATSPDEHVQRYITSELTRMIEETDKKEKADDSSD